MFNKFSVKFGALAALVLLPLGCNGKDDHQCAFRRPNSNIADCKTGYSEQSCAEAGGVWTNGCFGALQTPPDEPRVLGAVDVGDMEIPDVYSGTKVTVHKGMPISEVIRAATESRVSVEKVNDAEWRVGNYFLFFNFDKLNNWVIPSLSINKFHQSLGIIQTDRTVSLCYTATNISSKPIIITEMTPSCGCTNIINDYNYYLKPGESTDIHVTFDPMGFHGLTNKSITINTNSSSFPKVIFTFDADVQLLE